MHLQITKGVISSIYKEFLQTPEGKDGHANIQMDQRFEPEIYGKGNPKS